ncbi:hypothetical protein [Cloacibacillus sp. An23]|uniref:hypothetical protein n=1 Tax=Cloacibacillus sp. An23 TaxID=1965591 RepID=UPI000B398F84|nr:hypothetical protein [Cloacibacillus sp. An23]OUO94769.1 hypothetical protein B5F39_02560 [Cloacibacillus sp. An23]
MTVKEMYARLDAIENELDELSEKLDMNAFCHKCRYAEVRSGTKEICGFELHYEYLDCPSGLWVDAKCPRFEEYRETEARFDELKREYCEIADSPVSAEVTN